MPNVLQPTGNSDENLDAFLDTIQDAGLRELLKSHLQTILVVGRSESNRESQAGRDAFFKAVSAWIEKRQKEE